MFLQGIDLCTDMRMDNSVDDLSVGMWADMCADMCVVMTTNIQMMLKWGRHVCERVYRQESGHVLVCIGMSVEICVDTCADMCPYMCGLQVRDEHVRTKGRNTPSPWGSARFASAAGLNSFFRSSTCAPRLSM